MRLEELKKGFWGYQKDAVFQYITQQEEAFAQKIEEKDTLLERADRQAQTRIRDLEQENRALKEELGRLRYRRGLLQAPKGSLLLYRGRSCRFQ